jgi:hypothetical protein
MVMSVFAGATSASAQSAQAQQFPLTDTKGLIAHNLKIETAEYKGRKAVRLTQSEDAKAIGFAVLEGLDFQDGVVEADFAAKITTPPGVRMPGFIGIAFRVRPDDVEHHELFYVRPGNSVATDQAMRNHAAQYVAGPGYSWYKLRREWPWVYEAWTEMQPEAWNHLKIEVAGRTAKLYLNNSDKPTLIIDGLKGEDLHGAIALHGYAGEEAYFSNLRVTPAAPQPIKNGSDATGEWQVKLNTDIGMFDGTLQLHREGKALSGTWSGVMGKDTQINAPVTGTWRDGYVELTFTIEWPKNMPPGAPGTAAASMAGWIDDASAKGRVKFEGRTDGFWTATRK